MSTFVQQDHIALAMTRLLEQYRGKPNLIALLSGLVTPQNSLEQTMFDLLNLRTLDGSIGQQLDNLGSIVGMARQGFGDDDYRLRIKARIFINISNGDPENLIYVFKLLSASGLVILDENYPGDVGLYGNGVISDSQIQFVADLLEATALGGVRIAAMGQFDAVQPFAMDGVLYPAGGFGDTTDPTAGGKLGSLYQKGSFFQMAGDDPSGGGFGDYQDPVVGGRIVSL